MMLCSIDFMISAWTTISSLTSVLLSNRGYPGLRYVEEKSATALTDQRARYRFKMVVEVLSYVLLIMTPTTQQPS